MYQTQTTTSKINTCRIVKVTIGRRTNVAVFGGHHGLLADAIARCIQAIEDRTPMGELRDEFDVHIKIEPDTFDLGGAEAYRREHEA